MSRMLCRGAEKRLRGKRQSVWLLLVGCCLFLIPFSASASADDSIVQNGYRVDKNLVYGPSLGAPMENMLDVYMPVQPEKRLRPIVIWVHGGGWYQGGKHNTAEKKARLFLRRGYLFASVNYRLSPPVLADMGFPKDRVRHPAAVNDTARAVAWLSKRAKRFGGDGRRIILLGHSAGGQIVSMLGTDRRYLAGAGVSSRNIRGVVALDPVGLDLDRLANARTSAGKGSEGGYRRMIWNAFAAPWEPGYRATIGNASPIVHADRSDPPFLTVTSSQSGWRTREGREMSRLLGQKPVFGAKGVNLSHREINHWFGLRGGDAGMTTRALRFSGWVSSKRSAVTVAQGTRVYRLRGSQKQTEVVMRLQANPRGSVNNCRVNKSAYFRCGSQVRFLAGKGSHRLAVRPTDPTGRPGRVSVVRVQVLDATSRSSGTSGQS